MISRTEIVTIFSDVTGDKLDDPEEVKVRYRGKTYIVDIDANNADAELEELTLARAIEVGRVERPKRRARRSTTTDVHTQARQWAQANGVEVGKRGNVSQDVMKKYLAAIGSE